MNKAEEQQEKENQERISRHPHCALCGSPRNLMLICSHCHDKRQAIQKAREKWFAEEHPPLEPKPEIPDGDEPEPFEPGDDDEETVQIV